jgi:molybdenum cofactor synthesis domain-containing protein
MQRSPSSPLLPLALALERMLAGVRPVPPRRVPIRSALGAVAGEDIRPSADVPSRAVAVRDGWAVAFAAVAGASPNSPVLLPTAPCWIEAGTEMPEDADTVLPPDAFELGADREAIVEAAPGEGVARPGMELRAGDPIVRSGERIGPQHLLALAYAGLREINIRIPRICLLATGAERERNALAPVLAALVTDHGGEPLRTEPARDGLDGTAAAITTAAEAADAVLVLGGTGFGRTDHSAAALERVGVQEAHGIGLRPGETAGFGRVAGQPVLLLPGRPDACLAAFLALGRPVLARLAGRTVHEGGAARPLARKLSSGIGVSEAFFVRRAAAGLEPLGSAGIPLRRLLTAEGVVLVPPDREGYPQGAAVEMMPLWTCT